ncbi:hypothetical protein DITRI_Ditri02bG0170800 [Diplodiscus trichospermus]
MLFKNLFSANFLLQQLSCYVLSFMSQIMLAVDGEQMDLSFSAPNRFRWNHTDFPYMAHNGLRSGKEGLLGFEYRIDGFVVLDENSYPAFGGSGSCIHGTVLYHCHYHWASWANRNYQNIYVILPFSAVRQTIQRMKREFLKVSLSCPNRLIAAALPTLCITVIELSRHRHILPLKEKKKKKSREIQKCSPHFHVLMLQQTSNFNRKLKPFQLIYHINISLFHFSNLPIYYTDKNRYYSQKAEKGIPPNLLPFNLKQRSQFQSPSQSHEPPKRDSSSLTLKRFQLHCGISSDNYNADNEKSFKDWIEWVGEVISTAFPIWVSVGYDLRGALAMPKELISGFLLQYSQCLAITFKLEELGDSLLVMPLSGFFVSKLLNLPSHYAAGLILVGCCPGGIASNIVTYIAPGNVALSVLMTAASTMSAVITTPFLTAKLAGQYVAVDAAGLLFSTMQVVLLPVLSGAFLNQYFQGLVKFVSPLMPPITVGTVAILCGNAIAQNASAILASGQQVLLAASLLHASGFFFGYILSRVLGLDVASSRTISIEVGMQNLVLGFVLASQHFQNSLAAVPCAVSVVCHSIFGSILAGIWRRDVPKQKHGMHNWEDVNVLMRLDQFAVYKDNELMRAFAAAASNFSTRDIYVLVLEAV